MAQNKAQEEELEVLRAIYEEDELFNELNESTFQYRFGELGQTKSFVVEVQWPDMYPECLPHINLNTFYNKHISKELKEIIVEKIKTEMAENVGLAMTFTVFSWVGENFEQLIEKHLDLVYTEVSVLLLLYSKCQISVFLFADWSKSYHMLVRGSDWSAFPHVVTNNLLVL